MADFRAYAAKVVGVISGCTNPESAELLTDGSTVVFTNCALSVGLPFRGGAGIVYRRGESFLSSARLDERGLRLERRALTTGLTATLGLDCVRSGSAMFPAGTIFNANGGNPITSNGADVDKGSLACALAVDPLTGAIVGRIPLGDGSVVAQVFNPLEQPNGMAVADDDTMYVSDIPNTNPDADPSAPPPVPPAVYRIPVDAWDGLASGDAASGSTVRRVVMTGYVNGTTTSPVDGSCWAVSCSPVDPVGGGIYHLTGERFESGEMPEPSWRGLGILDGIGVTRRGTVLASNPVTGQIFAFPESGEHLVLDIPEMPVKMPADFNVVYPSAFEGEPVLLVPDISVGSPAGTASVAAVSIPGL